MQVVSLGRNGAGMADELLGEQRHEQLAVEPGLGAVLVVFPQMTQLRQRFDALERQFDLPSEPVALEDHVGIEIAFREGGEDDHVLSVS